MLEGYCGYRERRLAASAQEHSDAQMKAAQANNPLANMTASNLHNYYIGETSGSGGES